MPHTTLPQGRRSRHETGRQPDTPPNHNRAWSQVDEDDLLRLFRLGTDIPIIAAHMGRTTGAINARLSQLLGIAFPDTPNNYRRRGEPIERRATRSRTRTPYSPWSPSPSDFLPANQIQPAAGTGPQVTFAWPSPYTTDSPIAGSQEMVPEPGTPNPGWRRFQGSIQQMAVNPPNANQLRREWDTWLAEQPPDAVPTPPPDAVPTPTPDDPQHPVGLWESAWQPVGPETRARDAETLRSLVQPIAARARRAVRVQPYPRPEQPAPPEVPPHLEAELPLTKKHFVALATEIQSLRPPTQEGRAAAAQHSTLNKLAYRLASLFEGENSSFDRDRWLQACGVATSERT